MISELNMSVDPAREKALADYRKKLLEHKEVGGLYNFPFRCLIFIFQDLISAVIL